MSEAKYGPAPWLITGDFEPETDMEIVDDNLDRVCVVGPFLETWTEKEKADAYLIAAAPELYVELKFLFTIAIRLRALSAEEQQRIAGLIAKALGSSEEVVSAKGA